MATCSNKQREAATLARPRHSDPQHPVLGAVGARQLGGDEAVVLEEVRGGARRDLGEVVGLARLAAHRAGKQRPTLGGDLDVQLVGLRAGVEPLADQFPGRRHPEPKGQNVVGVHGRPSVPFRRRVPSCSCRSRTLRAAAAVASRPSLTVAARGGLPQCDALSRSNMTSSRLRAVVLAIAASLLAGCATVRSDGAPCPPVVNYSPEFLARAADELASLPAGSAIEQRPLLAPETEIAYGSWHYAPSKAHWAA